MPFNLSQIFGGWRRKEKKGRAVPGSSPRSSRSRLTLPRSEAGSDASHGPSEARSPKVAFQTKNKSELAGKLLVAPHISEKAAMQGEPAHYIFKVADNANKQNLKQAVEDRYGVDVEAVNIVAARGKKRRRGNNVGFSSGFKKAIIKLKAGQTISEF